MDILLHQCNEITLGVYVKWVSVITCPLPFINLNYRTYVLNHRLKAIYSNCDQISRASHLGSVSFV